MDRGLELAHLAVAEKAVNLGERHILQQEARVAELDRDGHDTAQALATLAIFRKNQAEHVAHRDLILKMLQEDAARPRLGAGPIFQPGHYDGGRVTHEQTPAEDRTVGRPKGDGS
jgi:hypothetical protein